MRILQEHNYTGNNGTCFLVFNCTSSSYGLIKQEYNVVDAWLTTNSTHNIGESAFRFDVYIVLLDADSMLFKLSNDLLINSSNIGNS